jgi:ribose transport system ATP-binding protein
LSRRGCFREVSLKVARGEIVGLAGLVGAGRTELGRAIFGAEPAESGQLFLEGRPLAVRSSRQAIRQGIGYLTEDRKSHGLYLDFDVKNNLVSNHLRDFCSRIGSLKPGKIEEFAEGSVRDFRISTPGINQILGNLSGGNQQKVLVSAWFGIRPKFLIVDEPTRGVDVGARSDIYSTLREFARRGIGILLISSDLPEILGLSDRVYVMREGRIAGELSRDQASEQNVIGLATGVQTTAKEHSI